MIQLAIHKTLQAGRGAFELAVDLQIPSGTFLTLYGKSGAGKTSILRMLAGLLTPDEGQIVVNDRTWFDRQQKIDLPVQKRKVGYVFQDYALFPNMTVKENLHFALRKGQNTKHIEGLIELVALGEFQHRKPHTLSGGQQQRVALARALVPQPQILLLDEPLSALDHELRIKLQDYLLKLHQTYQLTTILVSHDMGELLKLSDQVALIEAGKIKQLGKPLEVFSNQTISGKFQFTGEVIALNKQGFITIVSILIGKELVRVIADEKETQHLTIGDQVLVASKAFNPIIRKIVT